MPETALVLVPLSGGGLASGVAAAIRSRLPTAKVVGVSMERGAAMAASLAAGRPTDVQEVETLADSLGGGIGLDNRLTFRMCRTLLDDVILLSEEEIAAGIRHAALIEELTVEGAGAVGIAALLAGKIKSDGPTVVVVSGAISIRLSIGQSLMVSRRRWRHDARVDPDGDRPSQGRSAR